MGARDRISFAMVDIVHQQYGLNNISVFFENWSLLICEDHAKSLEIFGFLQPVEVTFLSPLHINFYEDAAHTELKALYPDIK